MPTFQRPFMLKRAIESVIAQTFKEWELIIVSDGDETALDTVKQFSDPRIVYIMLPRRYRDTGSTPKNIGIILSHADFIAYLDDDNIYNPNHLETLYNLIQEKKVDFVYCSTELRNQSDPNVIVGIRNEPAPGYGAIDTSEVLHKKELIWKFGLWKNTDYTDVYPWGELSGNYGTDWNLFSRWLEGKATWAHSNKVTLIYNYRR